MAADKEPTGPAGRGFPEESVVCQWHYVMSCHHSLTQYQYFACAKTDYVHFFMACISTDLHACAQVQGYTV